MINVTLDENGDVLYRCVRCGKATRVKMEWSASPLWEFFNGQAILVMVGHVKEDHNGVRT